MDKNKPIPSQLDYSIITQNTRARHEYFIGKEFESGLVLQGWEVKSIRAGKANISNSYISIKTGEAYLVGAHFQPIELQKTVHDPIRTRKLLLNKNELDVLYHHITCKGCTIIALTLYWKRILVKLKISIAKGKKEHDKRIDIKKREWQRSKCRLMKRNV